MHRTDLIYANSATQDKFEGIQAAARYGDDSAKIALKCEDCVLCIRDILKFEYYKLNNNRSTCPTTCILYEESTKYRYK